MPVASYPPKRLRADNGTAGGSVTRGKSLSTLNMLLQDSRLTVEQGVPALPTLPVITSFATSSHLEEGVDRTDSVTGPSLRTISARNLSLSFEVRMRVEYNILEKRKWRSLAEEKNILLEAKDKEIEDLKSQLLKAKEESAEVTQLRAQVSGLEASENSLRGEVASAKDHNVLLEQECNSL
ncbi:hypothetical protein Tco_0202716, partial [Tanacetum coccineum]